MSSAFFALPHATEARLRAGFEISSQQALKSHREVLEQRPLSIINCAGSRRDEEFNRCHTLLPRRRHIASLCQSSGRMPSRGQASKVMRTVMTTGRAAFPKDLVSTGGSLDRGAGCTMRMFTDLHKQFARTEKILLGPLGHIASLWWN